MPASDLDFVHHQLQCISVQLEQQRLLGGLLTVQRCQLLHIWSGEIVYDLHSYAIRLIARSASLLRVSLL
jgi:hypothetical protein